MRNFSSAIITILLSVVLLFLFHFESLYLGPIKVSHLWKGSLLVYLLFVLIQKGKIKPYIYGPLLLLSIMQLVNIELINNPLNSITLFSTTFILPLIGMYAFKFSPKQLQKSLLFFSSFFILCFLPYVLGLLTSLEEGYDLTKYSDKSVLKFGLIGPFQNPHTASLTLAASLIVIVYFWLLGIVNKAYFGAIIIFGFYCLLTTYVRTGLAMLLVASIPMLAFFVTRKAGNLIRATIVGATFISLTSLWVVDNQILIDRIEGKSKYGSESSFATAGSGRGAIYLNALEIYSESNFIEKIIGMGNTQKVTRMSKKMGYPFGAHNAFLDILLSTGAIGLLLFFIYLRNILKLIKSSDNQYCKLGTSMFMAYLTMSFFQGYGLITVNILFFLILALLAKTKN